ncbi:MAG: DinB family protein [Gemmatimonadales bacterium]
MGAAPLSALGSSILGAWRTNARVTSRLIEALPHAVWDAAVPDYQRKTVRDVAAHLHNARVGWLRTLGSEHGIKQPARIVQRGVTQKQLVAALARSSAGMEALLELALANGGSLPRSKRYVWQNLSLDVAHVLTYFVAHEAHHRGQIVMVARQAGERLPSAIVAKLWWWKPESRGGSRSKLG